jgi:formiminotetrahydrofolate cyclodeaminase
VAAHGHRAASSDVGVALALLQAGLEGARLNVRINLGGLSDRAYLEAVTAESERLSGRMSGLVRDAIAAMG